MKHQSDAAVDTTESARQLASQDVMRVSRIAILSVALTLLASSCQRGGNDNSYLKEDRSTWGGFEAWSRSDKFQNAYEAMVTYAQNAVALASARESFEREKQRNDSSEVPPGEWEEPIFPETSGSFQFVQILSQYEGTSVFRASDGLFVLMLSPGDSFRAYEGQSVRMTMHNRGETMSLTMIGTAVVFRSGSSPTRRRRFDGFSPDRAREEELRDAVAEMEDLQRSSIDSMKERLAGPFHARIEVRIESDLSPSRFLVLDRNGPVFCITDRDAVADCPNGADEYISLLDLRLGSRRSTRTVKRFDRATLATGLGVADPERVATPPTRREVAEPVQALPVVPSEALGVPAAVVDPMQDSEVLQTREKLAETRDIPVVQMKDVTRFGSVRASSILPDDLGYSFGPDLVVDGSLHTSWQASAKRTRGVGEWLELRFEQPRRVASIEVANGFQSIFHGQDLFVMNARLRKAQIDLGSHTQTFEFGPHQTGFVSIPIEPPTMTSSIRIRALSVHRGTRWPDLAISEIRVLALEPSQE